MTEIQPYASLDALHQATADAFCQAVTKSLAEKETFSVSLSGGSTPKRLYEILATRDLPWDRIHWFWGDERNVPADHDDSNQRMVRQAMLGPAGVAEPNIHAVDVRVDDPVGTAAAYQDTLKSFFAGQEFPAWDLVLLGMGDDAHTASLFPETKALDETGAWFVENWVPKFDAFRYTLTAPAITSGRNIWFLIAGANKQTAMGQVLGDDRKPALYPSQLITPTQWFVTADAMPRTGTADAGT